MKLKSIMVKSQGCDTAGWMESSQNPRGRERAAKPLLLVVCAYNEVKTLPELLPLVSNRDVLVVDDGSTDMTGEMATRYGATLIIHPERYGKTASFQEAIDFARERGYSSIVQIDADTIPSPRAVQDLLTVLSQPDVGGASVWQIPVGPRNVSTSVDELIWSLLNHGKRAQMARNGTCHTGGVMHAFRLEPITKVVGAINDDEQVSILLRRAGLRTVFVSSSYALFDSSSSIGHIIERRRRMITGHLIYPRSTAPSMDFASLRVAIPWSLKEKPGRLPWLVPAVAIEFVCRLLAWRDSRNPEAMARARRWVTTYAKNSNLHSRHRDLR